MLGGEAAHKIMTTCFDRIVPLGNSYGIKRPKIFLCSEVTL